MYRRNPSSAAEFYLDCQHCMSKQSAQQRQMMGCGYEPQIPYANVWSGESMGRVLARDEVDDRGRLHLPICSGYVCSLPEVIEASEAHYFLKNGGLGQICDGEHPSEPLRLAVRVLEGEMDKLIAHRQREAEANAKAGH